MLFTCGRLVEPNLRHEGHYWDILKEKIWEVEKVLPILELVRTEEEAK